MPVVPQRVYMGGAVWCGRSRAHFPHSKRGPVPEKGLNTESRFIGKFGICVSTRLTGQVVVVQQSQYLGTEDPSGLGRRHM